MQHLSAYIKKSAFKSIDLKILIETDAFERLTGSGPSIYEVLLKNVSAKMKNDRVKYIIASICYVNLLEIIYEDKEVISRFRDFISLCEFFIHDQVILCNLYIVICKTIVIECQLICQSALAYHIIGRHIYSYVSTVVYLTLLYIY
jgi:hypothetical protein